MKRCLLVAVMLILAMILLQVCGDGGGSDTLREPALDKQPVASGVVKGAASTGTNDTGTPNPKTKHYQFTLPSCQVGCNLSGPMFTLIFITGIIVLWIMNPAPPGGRQSGRARKLASALGLRCLEGREAAESALTASGYEGVRESLAKAPSYMQRFLEKAAGWRLEGMIDNIRVAVWPEHSGGKNPSTWTVVRAYYPAPLAFELTLASEGIMTKLGKAIFGLKDLEFGDPVFDPKVRVKTSDPAQAKSRLDIETRRAFVRLLEVYPDAVGHRAYVQWQRQGLTFNETEIRSVLKALAETAVRMKETAMN